MFKDVAVATASAAFIITCAAVTMVVASAVTASDPEIDQGFSVLPFRRSPERRLQEGTSCPQPNLVCEDVSGKWVEMNNFLDFSLVIGRGYKGAFDRCAEDPQMTPYGLSHAGGVYADEFHNLKPRFVKPLINYAKAVGVDDFKDMHGGGIIHFGGYATSCPDSKYFKESRTKYACGLQYLLVQMIYRPEFCARFRETGDTTVYDSTLAFKIFDEDAPVSDELKELDFACEFVLGDLPVFDGLNELVTNRGATKGFVNFNTSFTLLSRISTAGEKDSNGRKNPNWPVEIREKERFEFLTKRQLTGECRLDVALQIGHSSCDSPVVNQETAFEHVLDFEAVDTESYDLGAHGYVYDSANELWHHGTATGCGKGCCDECFQWYCPTHYKHWGWSLFLGRPRWFPRYLTDGSGPAKFDCQPYTYACTVDRFPFTDSSEQVCGVPTNDENVRRRC